jgi:hypothetical protein
MSRPKASMMAVFVTGTIVAAGAFVGWVAASVPLPVAQAEETRSSGTEPKPVGNGSKWRRGAVEFGGAGLGTPSLQGNSRG